MGEAWPVKIRYTPEALADLAAILEYIAERAPRGAERLKNRLKAAEQMLGLFPSSCPTCRRYPWLRRTLVSPYPYAIFYEVAGEEIWIHAVRHTSRRPLGG